LANLIITREHELSVKEAKAVAQNMMAELEREYNIESEWDGDTLNFERSGINGCLDVSKDQLQIEMKLGMMLKPFQSKIEAAINDKLDELLA
jgi:putative polyhydroxyalkanoate system protein